jgi:hypothetical protein
MTLLQMVQNILSSMDSDEVNSINDTVESQQVAEILKETYYDLFSDIELPERTGIVKLEGLGDLERPNYLKLGDNVSSILWLKYRNTQNGAFEDLTYLAPFEFMEKVLQNKSNTSDVDFVTDESGVGFYVKNNQSPSYYTIINDKYLITDSYDSAYDTTLQASKTFAWGELITDWENEDDFIPPIDTDLFPLFLSEAKSTCFITLKQTTNAKEEQRSRRHRIHLQYRKFRDKNARQQYWNGVNYARHR